jgi:hypothetical protein
VSSHELRQKKHSTRMVQILESQGQFRKWLSEKATICNLENKERRRDNKKKKKTFTINYRVVMNVETI